MQEGTRQVDLATLTLLLPALNEEEGILAALDEAERELSALVRACVLEDYEIVVVDDGSTDATAAIVAARAADSKRVILLRQPRNRGVGAAFRAALDVASSDLILYTDADMPINIDEVRRAVPLLNHQDVGLVAGQRRIYGADGRARAIAARMYDRCAQAVLRIPIRDVNFPFKLLALDLARSVGTISDGALLDAELLARVGQRGLRIETLEMDYRARQFGRSKTMSVRLLGQLVVEAVRHRRTILRDRS
jgi:glycosyltransferase involved in cell wall biosynthesis